MLRTDVPSCIRCGLKYALLPLSTCGDCYLATRPASEQGNSYADEGYATICAYHLISGPVADCPTCAEAVAGRALPHGQQVVARLTATAERVGRPVGRIW